MLKGFRITLAAFLFSPAVCFAVADLTTLLPDETHKNTIKEIVRSLNSSHYNKVSIDDSLSSNLLDKYLDELDPSRSLFYQVDIDEFQAYRQSLDDAIKSGDLEIPFHIFNRLQVRTKEQLTRAIDRLEDPTPFNLTLDEFLDTNREDDPWVVTEAEMHDLWRQRVKSALLNLILADKTEEQARETLIKRYKNQLARLAQTKSEDVFQRFANTFTKYFDPHTAYFSPRTSENFKINMSLSLEGIGAVLQSENEFTKITRLVPAGPADKTGQLKATDIIVGVGQGKEGEIEDVVGWRLDDVVDKIRGPKGSMVRLEIISSDDKSARRIVSIERNTVKLEEQAAQKRIIDIVHNDRTYKIGVIDIPAFYIDFAALQRGEKDYKSTTRDVEKLVTELTQEGIHGLIIDLRNNGGGSLREANELVGLFIDRGPTVQIRDPSGRVDILGDFNPKVAYSGPLGVVVNRLSASASEIFAGAIQDYQRGIVMGSQTFGKGTVQTLLPLSHGQLKFTNAKFYRISGESTQNKGVVPDISFPSLYDPNEVGESSLQRALPWDTVQEARHGVYRSFSPIKQTLEQNHIARIENQPDFNYMREQIARLAEMRKDESIPLNYQKLQEKRDQADKWQLDAENKRRLAKGLTPISSLSELEDSNKDDSGRPLTPESEAILHESGMVLLDYVALTGQLNAANH